ncbi:MAG: PQQ-binding-like beta-propeller repeat protein [Verrucomicrobia bacterium]|nr:PQQ-binding-like beta-propeller repeat protein [Verrucomicrobiota bacterium]
MSRHRTTRRGSQIGRRLLLLLPVLLACVTAAASNWPQFRGPGARGVSEEKNLPNAWSTNQNVAWVTEVPGRGWSSPIVWGERVFVTSVVSDGQVEPPKKGLYFGGERPTPPKDTHRWFVLCLDLPTGNIAWNKQVHEGPPANPVHLKNNHAAETPVTDGERVYAYFGNHGLFCLDLQGNEVWSQKWPSQKIRNGWGTAASPLLHGDRLYIVNDNDEHAFLVALNKKTGKELWRADRDEKSNWATPYVWQNEKRAEIITPGTRRVRSYDLDGKLLWEFGGMSSIVIPTPFAAHGLLYVCSGYVGDQKRPVFALKPGAAGDISLKDGETSNEFIAWCQRTAGPYNPSPLVSGDHFYVLFDFGFLSCHDARTGKELYGKQRLNTDGASAFTASPWAYDGRIFCLSEDGDTFVIQAGPEYKLLRKNSLDEMCLATPAIAQGSLLLRTASKLYRIRNSGAK